MKINKIMCLVLMAVFVFGALMPFNSIAQKDSNNTNGTDLVFRADSTPAGGTVYTYTTTQISLSFGFDIKVGNDWERMSLSLGVNKIKYAVNNGSFNYITSWIPVQFQPEDYKYTKTLTGFSSGDYIHIYLDPTENILNYGGTQSLGLSQNMYYKIRDTPYTPPTIDITKPTTGDSWIANSNHKIFWNITDGTAPYKVWLNYTDGLGLYYPITNYTVQSSAGMNWYLWAVADTPSVNCQINITTVDSVMGKDNDYSMAFTILADYTPQTITIDRPLENEEWYIGEQHYIIWNVSDGTSPYQVYLNYSYDEGVTYYPVTTAITQASTGMDYYLWTIPEPPGAFCYINATVLDSVYGKDNNISSKFIISSPPASLNDDFSFQFINANITAGAAELRPYCNGTGNNIALPSVATIWIDFWLYYVSNGSYVHFLNDTATRHYTDTYDCDNYLVVPNVNTTEVCRFKAKAVLQDGFNFLANDNNKNGICEISREALSDPFTINPMTVTLTSPTGGELWHIGDYHNITANITGGLSPYNITVFYANLPPTCSKPNHWTMIDSYTTSNSTIDYNWTIPNFRKDTCYVYIYTNDSQGGISSDTNDLPFSIISPAINCNISHPVLGDNYTEGDTLQINYTVDGGLVPYDILLQYSTDGENYTNIASDITQDLSGDGNYTWDIPDLGETYLNCTIQMMVTDNSTNHTTGESEEFVLYYEPPIIIPPITKKAVTVTLLQAGNWLRGDVAEATAYAGEGIVITVDVECLVDINSVTVYYHTDLNDTVQTIDMELLDGTITDGSWTASIPAQDAGTLVTFNVSAVSIQGKVGGIDDVTVEVVVYPSTTPAFNYETLLRMLTSVYFWLGVIGLIALAFAFRLWKWSKFTGFCLLIGGVVLIGMALWHGLHWIGIMSFMAAEQPQSGLNERWETIKRRYRDHVQQEEGQN